MLVKEGLPEADDVQNLGGTLQLGFRKREEATVGIQGVERQQWKRVVLHVCYIADT